jgi:cobalt/nickel transport system permease protein
MTRMRLAAFIVAGLVVALALAFFVAPEASSKPDGLNKVAIDQGFSDHQRPHRTEDSPLAGYGVRGVGSDRLSRGLSGAIGVGVVFTLAGGGVLLARRARSRRPSAPASPVTDGG